MATKFDANFATVVRTALTIFISLYGLLAPNAAAADDGCVPIAGFVVDAETRLPIEGAKVVLDAEHQAETALLGVFVIPPVDPGTQRLTVSAIGYETASTDVEIEDCDDTRRVTIPIERPNVGEVEVVATITPMAYDIMTGLPIDGAQFSITVTTDPAGDVPAPDVTNPTRIVTGSDGTAEPVQLPLGYYTFEVSAPGYSPVSHPITGLLEDHAIVARLAPETTDLTVTVTGPDLADGGTGPLANVAVWVKGVDPRDNTRTVLAPYTQRTNQLGQVKIEHLPPADYIIEVAKPGFRADPVTISITADPPDETTAAVAMNLIGTSLTVELSSEWYVGRLLSQLGEAKLVGVEESETEGIEIEADAQTVDGTPVVVFEDIIPGQYRVEATMADWRFGLEVGGVRFSSVVMQHETGTAGALVGEGTENRTTVELKPKFGTVSGRINAQMDTTVDSTDLERTGLTAGLLRREFEPYTGGGEVCARPLTGLVGQVVQSDFSICSEVNSEGRFAFSLPPGLYGIEMPDTEGFTGYAMAYEGEWQAWPYFDWLTSPGEAPPAPEGTTLKGDGELEGQAHVYLGSDEQYLAELYLAPWTTTVMSEVLRDRCNPLMVAGPVLWANQTRPPGADGGVYAPDLRNGLQAELNGTTADGQSLQVAGEIVVGAAGYVEDPFDIPDFQNGLISVFGDIPPGTYTITMTHPRHMITPRTVTVPAWAKPGETPATRRPPINNRFEDFSSPGGLTWATGLLAVDKHQATMNSATGYRADVYVWNANDQQYDFRGSVEPKALKPTWSPMVYVEPNRAQRCGLPGTAPVGTYSIYYEIFLPADIPGGWGFSRIDADLGTTPLIIYVGGQQSNLIPPTPVPVNMAVEGFVFNAKNRAQRVKGVTVSVPGCGTATTNNNGYYKVAGTNCFQTPTLTDPLWTVEDVLLGETDPVSGNFRKDLVANALHGFSGLVVDDRGVALEDANIRVWDPHYREIFTLNSNPNGQFSSQNMDVGEVRLEVTARGFKRELVGPYTLTPGTPTRLPTVKLDPADPPTITEFGADISGFVLEGIKVYTPPLIADNPVEAKFTAKADDTNSAGIKSVYLVRAFDGSIPAQLSDDSIRYPEWSELNNNSKIQKLPLRRKLDDDSNPFYETGIDMSGAPVGLFRAWVVVLTDDDGIAVQRLSPAPGKEPLSVVGTSPWTAYIFTLLATIDQFGANVNMDPEEIRKFVGKGRLAFFGNSTFAVEKDSDNYVSYKVDGDAGFAPGIGEVPVGGLGWLRFGLRGKLGLDVNGRGTTVTNASASLDEFRQREEIDEDSIANAGTPLRKLVIGGTATLERTGTTETRVVGSRLVDREQVKINVRGEVKVESEWSLRKTILGILGLPMVEAALSGLNSRCKRWFNLDEKCIEIDLLLTLDGQFGSFMQWNWDTGWPSISGTTAERGVPNTGASLLGTPSTYERTWGAGLGLKMGFKLGLNILPSLFDKPPIEANGWFGATLKAPSGDGNRGLSGLTFTFRAAPAQPVLRSLEGEFFFSGEIELKGLFYKYEKSWESKKWKIEHQFDTDSTLELVPMGGTTVVRSTVPPIQTIVISEREDYGDRMDNVFPENNIAGSGGTEDRVGAVIVSRTNDEDPDGLAVSINVFEDGKWRSSETVPGSERAVSVAVQKRDDGSIVVVWSAAKEDEQSTVVKASVRDENGNYSPPVDISDERSIAHSLELVDTSSGVLLAWLSTRGNSADSRYNKLKTAELVDSTWSAPEVVREEAELHSISVASNGTQQAIGVATGDNVELFTRENAAWSDAAVITTTLSDVAVAYPDGQPVHIAAVADGELKVWRWDGALTDVGAIGATGEAVDIDLKELPNSIGDRILVIAWLSISDFRKTTLRYAVARVDGSTDIEPTEVVPEASATERTAVAIWPSENGAWLVTRAVIPETAYERIEEFRVSLDAPTSVDPGQLPKPDDDDTSGGGGCGCTQLNASPSLPVGFVLIGLVGLRLRRRRTPLPKKDILGLLIVFAVGCGSNGEGVDLSDIEVPVPCTSDVECPVDRYCDGTFCIEGCRVEPNNCLVGVCDAETNQCIQCATDADCAFGTCVQNICEYEPECATDDECGADQFCSADSLCESGCRTSPDSCSDQICNPDTRECVGCFVDGHCAADEFCDDGTCATAPNPCGEFGFCPTGQYCDMGECRPGCIPTFPDPCSPRKCEPTTRACVECLADGDCAGGAVCVDNACQAPTCTADSECAADEFCDGVCVVGCRTAPDNCGQGVCDANIRLCVECAMDSDCAFGTCDTGVCSIDTSCAMDTDCPDGAYCQAGTCASGCRVGGCDGLTCDTDKRVCVLCTDGSQCLSGWSCNQQLGQCSPECVSDAQCIGRCNTALGYCVRCLADSDCPGQFCDVARGTCVECQTDANCVSTLMCGSDGRCVGCENNSDCVQGFCAEGFCVIPGGPGPCSSCLTDAQCTEPGAECIEFTDALGNVIDRGCGQFCDGSNPCPQGYDCVGSQCRPSYVPDNFQGAPRIVATTCAAIRTQGRLNCDTIVTDSCGVPGVGDGHCALLQFAGPRECALRCVDDADCPAGKSCLPSLDGFDTCF